MSLQGQPVLDRRVARTRARRRVARKGRTGSRAQSTRRLSECLLDDVGGRGRTALERGPECVPAERGLGRRASLLCAELLGAVRRRARCVAQTGCGPEQPGRGEIVAALRHDRRQVGTAGSHPVREAELTEERQRFEQLALGDLELVQIQGNRAESERGERLQLLRTLLARGRDAGLVGAAGLLPALALVVKAGEVVERDREVGQTPEPLRQRRSRLEPRRAVAVSPRL